MEFSDFNITPEQLAELKKRSIYGKPWGETSSSEVVPKETSPVQHAREFFRNPQRMLSDWLPSGNGVRDILDTYRGLSSRINAGAVGPWDFWPGGMEGYIKYLQDQGVQTPWSAPNPSNFNV